MHGPANSARIGQPVPRKEDLRFVAGRGRYADDFNVDGQAYAWMVRSPHAHAVIRSIDVQEALRVPGDVAAAEQALAVHEADQPVGADQPRRRPCQ